MSPFFEMHSDILTLLFKIRPISIRKPDRTREGNAFIIQYGVLRGSLILHITVANEYHALCAFSSRGISIGDANLSRSYVACLIFDTMVYDAIGDMIYGSGSLWRTDVPPT